MPMERGSNWGGVCHCFICFRIVIIWRRTQVAEETLDALNDDSCLTGPGDLGGLLWQSPN